MQPEKKYIMLERKLLIAIKNMFFQGKAIILIGARQTGKTTLLKQLETDFSENEVLFLNCDEPEVIKLLTNASSTELRQLIGTRKLVFIDEAQRVVNIGITIKLMIDNIAGIQIIVSGSSAIGIRDKINESLTGRKIEYQLYPFSLQELINAGSLLEEKRLLERRIIYGTYPEVINNPDKAQKILIELTNSYMYKDILEYKNIRRSDMLNKLLTALSLQLGNEVNFNELGRLVGINNETVMRYLDLLEKVFIIFRLPSFSRNIRQELKKSQKVYFYDNGIRNALIQNFKSLDLRTDTGALWENFIICERKKYNEYNENYVNQYFWRTHAHQEIDYIEEKDGMLYAFEIKWNEKRRAKFPNSFAQTYPNHEFKVINRTNYLEFCGIN